MHDYADKFKVLVEQLDIVGSKISNDKLYFAMHEGLLVTYNVVADIICYSAK